MSGNGGSWLLVGDLGDAGLSGLHFEPARRRPFTGVFILAASWPSLNETRESAPGLPLPCGASLAPPGLAIAVFPLVVRQEGGDAIP